MKIYHKDNKLIIEIELNELAKSQENVPGSWGYSITDVNDMAEYFCRILPDFTNDKGRAEIGYSDFHKLIDDIFVDAFEFGEDWLLEYAPPE